MVEPDARFTKDRRENIRYTSDSAVTEKLIHKNWSEQRSSFRTYDDSADPFLWIARARHSHFS